MSPSSAHAAMLITEINNIRKFRAFPELVLVIGETDHIPDLSFCRLNRQLNKIKKWQLNRVTPNIFWGVQGRFAKRPYVPCRTTANLQPSALVTLLMVENFGLPFSESDLYRLAREMPAFFATSVMPIALAAVFKA